LTIVGRDGEATMMGNGDRCRLPLSARPLQDNEQRALWPDLWGRELKRSILLELSECGCNRRPMALPSGGLIANLKWHNPPRAPQQDNP